MKQVVGMITLQLLCVVLNVFIGLYCFNAFSVFNFGMAAFNLFIAYLWFRDRKMFL